MEPTKGLTKRVVDASAPGDVEYIVWDSEIAGFGLRVRPSGRKVYLLKYRVGGGRGGRMRKPSIGVHGEITQDQARKVAREWLAEARRGEDPGGRRLAERDAPRMEAPFERFLEEHARPNKKASSVQHDERMIARHLIPTFGTRKVAEVLRSDVSSLHQSLKATPYEANRVLAVLSKMFNLAELWGWRTDGSNPCRHVKRFREEKRTRFLSPQELSRLGAALIRAERGELTTARGARISPFAIAAIRLLIFTSARRGEDSTSAGRR